VFVLDGRIPIEHGEVKRVIRPIGVGRHKWLFTGSDETAVRLCIVTSVCATCRRLKINPWDYLRDVDDAIARGVSARQLALDWTPWVLGREEGPKREG
jgi:hypothetical protein